LSIENTNDKRKKSSRRRCRVGTAARDERGGDPVDVADAHQHDERVDGRREAVPVHAGLGLRRILVSGDDRK
jgi:hypothetical protein